MQHYGLRQFGRTILTITGILLLVIFGTRAASQATSLTAVGGPAKHFAYPLSLTPSELVALVTSSSSHGFSGVYTPVSQQAAVTPDPVVVNSLDNENDGLTTTAAHVQADVASLPHGVKADVHEASQRTGKIETPKVQQDVLGTDVK